MSTTIPTSGSAFLTQGRALIPALALALVVALSAPLCACASPTAGEGAADAAAEAAVEATGAQATSADLAGTVSLSGASEGGRGETAGTLVYTNERLGFVAELPAGYVEAEVAHVADGDDVVVLSATDDRSDACLVLTHELGEATGDGHAVAGTVEAGDGRVAGAGADEDGGAGDAGEVGGEAWQDAADDGPVASDGTDAADPIDPIDEWARSYAAWAIAGLEDDGATVTRAQIGRATLGGVPCTIVEIEFEPGDDAARGPSGEGLVPAHRDLFFFDGRGEGSRAGLVVDCLAWSQEALDGLENSFVAR